MARCPSLKEEPSFPRGIFPLDAWRRLIAPNPIILTAGRRGTAGLSSASGLPRLRLLLDYNRPIGAGREGPTVPALRFGLSFPVFGDYPPQESSAIATFPAV